MEGKSGWAYNYIEPVAGENDKMKDTQTRDKLTKEREGLYAEYESKTIEWLGEADPAKRTAINGQRTAIAQKLKEQYWQLDPYVRARTLYDRMGVIQPGGKLNYYPAAVSTTPAASSGVDTTADDVD